MRTAIVAGCTGLIGAQLVELLKNVLKIPIYIAEDPLTAVARGAGVVLDDLEYYREVLVDAEHEHTLH
jgi:rod shape-determining protein MreB